MRFGHAPDGSSPREQQELGINQDAVLDPQKGEGARLRQK
jgi:hypothetical protein